MTKKVINIHNGRTLINKDEINHEGSSEEMEAVAAVQIFSRSIETRKLKYTTFVGDGDSSSFGLSCPKSSDTWCKYWKDQNEKTSLYNEDNRLPQVFKKELEPIFTRLSNHDLLTRCLKGMTQNQNEAANGVLWSKCPKTRCCQQSIDDDYVWNYSRSKLYEGSSTAR
jgi:hypothetical protein